MATDAAVANAVARLFVAAGRSYGKLECQVFIEALADVTDEELHTAVRTIIRTEEWNGMRSPNPGMVRSVVGTIRRRAESNQNALPPPRADRDAAKTHLAGIRTKLGGL